MIKSIAVENFKCFNDQKEIPLSQINLFYGKNGRGKSTIIQILLLLAQTIRETNDIRNLSLVGQLVQLGSFKDLQNAYNGKITQPLKWLIQNDDESIQFAFEEFPNKQQLASLCDFIVNNINYLVSQGLGPGNGEVEDSTNNTCTMLPVSDIKLLQNLKNLQYVSADRFCPRDFSSIIEKADVDRMGARGENLINILANKGEQFQKMVGEALSKILHGAALQIKDNGADNIELFMNSADGDKVFKPINVGFGYSYVLPIIVAALMAKENSILIVENPEAHLHPGAQSRVMKFLIEIAKKKNLQLFIETHSDHVVNGLRIAMKQKYEGIIPADGEIVFFAHDNEHTNPEIEIINCDSEGELSAYPDDFLDEWSNQLIKLL